MRVVIQRCSRLKLTVGNELRCISEEKGLLVLAAWEEADNENENDIPWLVQKILHLRIFPDKEGKMNLCVKDINGYVVVVSNFTLFASTQKGNRPSFVRSANADKARLLYDMFVQEMKKNYTKCYDGMFGADNKIDFVNDGPVTILIDTKRKE